MDSEAHVDQFASSATTVTHSPPPPKIKQVSTTAKKKPHLVKGSPITTFLRADQRCHRGIKRFHWYKERDALRSQLQTQWWIRSDMQASIS